MTLLHGDDGPEDWDEFWTRSDDELLSDYEAEDYASREEDAYTETCEDDYIDPATGWYGLPDPEASTEQLMRRFETGATRDSSENKLDWEGHLEPMSLEFYVQYMHKHRQLPDGSRRASDNWQLGMPEAEAVKSAWRHFVEVWKAHRSGKVKWTPTKPLDPASIEEAACAVIFNMFVLLHGRLRAGEPKQTKEWGEVQYKLPECPTEGCTCRAWSAAQASPKETR